MDNSEYEHAYYYPGGIPVTPQARRFGYEFPVYVSKSLWVNACVAMDIPSRRDTSTDKRINQLLVACFEGMTKKLATEDDFVFYPFKHWYWERFHDAAKKKTKMKLGARLFLSPDDSNPWLYLFIIDVDSIDTLKKGEAPV